MCKKNKSIILGELFSNSTKKNVNWKSGKTYIPKDVGGSLFFIETELVLLGEVEKIENR